MKFKKHERVEYEKNTLYAVVFQARFPEILKISTELPSKFQDEIRTEGYPELELPPELPETIRKLASNDGIFFFLSEEKDWKVSLTKNFVALTCVGNYENYNAFKSRLGVVLKIFDDIYKPSYFNRIGLRYQNIINKEVLSKDDINVRDCIPAYIAPELKESLKNDVSAFDKVIVIKDQDDDSKASISHVLAKVSGKFGRYQITDLESYIVDIDCFFEGKIKEVNDAIRKCDVFNENIRNIFRWSITDELHRAMGPK